MSSADRSARPSGARLVAAGILTSRVFGLVRQKAFTWFFGAGAYLDVVQTALRLPNALQNLLGEQTLSAAFIPIYSRLLAEDRREEAGRFAGAVFGLLVAAASVLVILGVVFARPIVSTFAAGFLLDAERVAAGEMTLDRLELSIRAVRLVFPMTGILVLSAWALGVLNSHRRFLVSYMAPVAWNVAILAALGGVAAQAHRFFEPAGASSDEVTRWVLATCAGALVGGVFQFAVQLPLVFRLMGSLRLSLRPLAVPGVRDALRAFGPALMGRGVVQLTLYVNLFLASFLREGAPGVLQLAGLLVNLPLAAFGMSVAAAELPELSRAGEEASAEVSRRLGRALRQSAFVLCPATVGFLAFGFLVAGLFAGGQFTIEGTWLVYAVLLGYTLGLPATATSRILQNTFFALRDTRTPARIAAVRLVAGAGLGSALMLVLDRFPVAAAVGLERSPDGLYFGAVGLSLAAAVGDWVEVTLLRRKLGERLPGLRLPLGAVGRLFAAAALLALPAAGLWLLTSRVLPGLAVAWQALVVLPVYAAAYLGFAAWRRMEELELWLGRIFRRS